MKNATIILNSTLRLIFVLASLLSSQGAALAPRRLSQQRATPSPLRPRRGCPARRLQHQTNPNDTEDRSVALPPANSLSDNEDENENGIDQVDSIASMSSSSTAVMMSQEMRRVLIEELGYRRRDVDRMRVELAAPVIAKRARCPEGGMPASWYNITPDDDLRMQRQQLEDESRYPLKFPLLGVSLVLSGKGFADLAITLIKVGIDFPGASLSTTFQGVPVILVDALCIIAGGGLGIWTRKTMRDP